MINIVCVILGWTLYLYLIHRLVHIIPMFKRIHLHHHRYALSTKIKWHWSNLFLFNDNWIGTLDFWFTEVIPNIFFCYFFNVWWLFLLFWIYAGIIQERLEHDSKIDFPLFTAGKWHLLHHRMYNCNFGLYITLWDKIFQTEFKLSNQQTHL
jgi:sterol desaturase/sphingolipid hydroxylase (fatty acid hydroxylase superfamily)